MTKNGISIQPPRGKYLAIGMMSGTSCDGLDLALLEFDGRDFVFRKGHHTSYLPAQREAILNFITSEKNSLADVSQFNFYLAGIWARSVAEFLQSEKLTSGDILFLASHGQTAWHQPEESVFGGEKMISTLQLGDPSVLANLTGITTIGDFRVADMALGGQGAPLVPYFDWLYFSRFQKNIIALNIGGISNLTWLAAGAAPESVQAFDCGPGNMLVDQAMQRLYELPFDEDGRIARMGKFSERLHKHLRKIDPFPQQAPPKSTGREYYGKEFILEVLRKALRFRVPEPDVVHTLADYTAWCVRDAVEQFTDGGVHAEMLVVGGGGGRNPFIMERLQHYFPDAKVTDTAALDLDPEYKEAICFGVLGNELLHGKPANMPSVTGASRPALLGKICPV